MSIEAMKQWREALKEYCEHGAIFMPLTALKSIDQAIAEAEKQEPVAWMYDWTSDEGEFIQDWTTSMAETLRDTGKTVITNVRPLYSTPKVIHKPLQHFGEIPMAWCRWSEDLGKWMYTHRQPTEELAWIPLYTHPQPKREPEAWTPRIERHYKDGVLISQTIQYNPQGEKLPYPHEPVATGIEAQVCADIAQRQQLGLAKYGMSVADNPALFRVWLQHAYEECLDQAVYLKKAIELHDQAL